MPRERQKKRIAIFGYFGAGNLGDESVVGVVIRELRARLPGSEVFAICLNPQTVEATHRIPAFPVRRPSRRTLSSEGVSTDGLNRSTTWGHFFRRTLLRLLLIAPEEIVFLFRSYRRLRGTGLVIVGGSGQLIDNEGGPWNHPYNHFKWSCLSKLVGAKFVFLSVGAGPVETKLGRWFIRRTLSMASYRSFRDEYSRRLVENLGVRGENHVCPDQAFYLNADGAIAPPGPLRGKPAVGFAPIAYCDPRHWNESDSVRFRAYFGKMAEFIAWLARAGYSVLLFHTQVNGDDTVVAELLDEVRRREGTAGVRNVREHAVRWYDDAFSAIAQTDLVVASRFHAILFSYVCGRPALGISYHQKIADVMTELGQGACVLDIESFTVGLLKERFLAMEQNAVALRAELFRGMAPLRVSLREQYERVLV